MPTLLVSVLLSIAGLVVAIWAWRTMMADRQQIFDRDRIRHRWSTASWGRRIATVLAIPAGLGLGYLLIQAQESGAVPEAAIRLVVLVLMIFAVRSLAKTMQKERDREDR